MQGLVFMGMVTLIAGLCLWGKNYPDLFQRVGSRQNFFADKNAVPQVICSIALFLFFTGIRVKPVKALTLLSGASFGVYLIHDHMYFRGMIWNRWAQVWQACQGDGFWKTALLAPVVIYLTCAVIDMLRKYLLEKPLMKLLDPVFEKIDAYLQK